MIGILSVVNKNVPDTPFDEHDADEFRGEYISIDCEPIFVVHPEHIALRSVVDLNRCATSSR